MSDIWRQHLRAVIADPEADEPRLTLAAYIASQDPELARFIELQVADGRERRRVRRGHRGVSRPTEDGRLLRRNAARWTHTMAKYTAAQEFHRGFMAEISIEPNVFLEHGDWLLKQAPIRMVWF